MDFKLSVVFIIGLVPLEAMEIFCQLKNSLNFPGGRSFIMKLVGCGWVAKWLIAWSFR
jgi:hypothetical protein